VGSYPCSVTELRGNGPEETAKRLAREAADRGTFAEDVAAEVLNEHCAFTRQRSLPSSPCSRRPKGALSVAEAERRLEDGEDESFGR